MNWRDYAKYAQQSIDELARDCEVQVFRSKGPGGLQKIASILKRRAQPPRVRKKTKVPKAARERRLADKRHRSHLKRQRGRAGDEW